MIRKSLRLQILFPFLALIIAASGMVTWLGYRSGLNLAVDSQVEDMKVLVPVANQNLELFLKRHEHLASQLAGNDQVKRYLASGPSSKDGRALTGILQDLFQEALKADKQLVNVYAATTSKDIIVEPPSEMPAGYDPTSRDWFKRAVAKPSEPVWLEPYVDTATKSLVLAVSQAVLMDGKVVGVVGLDLKINSVMNIMNDITIGDTGYVFVMDAGNKLISHKREELVGADQSSEEFIRKIKETGKTGTFHYNYEGKEKIMSYITNETTGWVISASVYTSEFQRKARAIITPSLIGLFAVILVAGAVSWPVTQNIIRPVRRLQAAMKEFQEGKLSVRSGINKKNEIGMLATGFDEMAAQVGTLIDQIRQTSEKLGESAQVLLIGSSENAAASNEVAVTMQEIAVGAGTQAGIVERNVEMVAQISARLGTVEQETGEMERLTAGMLEISRVNVERLHKLSEQTSRSVEISRSVSQAMYALDEVSEQIGGIVSVISDITNQTNLLALNAAIEAARAGEQGRGFGVVAGEVRKLAGHSEEALRQVQELVDRIRRETKEAAALTEEAGAAMVRQEQAVKLTNEAFGSINEAVERHMSGIAQVVAAVKEMAESKDTISGNTAELQAICQTTAAGTEEVSASVEQQSASMEQLNHLARQLEEAANSLREEIKRFDA